MYKVDLVILMMLIFHGCSKENPPAVAATVQIPSSGPISLDVWKSVQQEEKFSKDILARLRQSDPALKSKQSWDRFMKDVVNPEFKRIRSL